MSPASKTKPKVSTRYRRQIKVGLPVEIYAALCIFAEGEDESTSAVVLSFIVHGLRRKGVPVKSILFDD